MVDIKLKGISDSNLLKEYLRDEYNFIIVHDKNKYYPFRKGNKEKTAWNRNDVERLLNRKLIIEAEQVENMDEIREYFATNESEERISQFVNNTWGYPEHNKDSLTPDELFEVANILYQKAYDLKRLAIERQRDEKRAIEKATVNNDTIKDTKIDENPIDINKKKIFDVDMIASESDIKYLRDYIKKNGEEPVKQAIANSPYVLMKLLEKVTENYLEAKSNN